jgi:hypothetical protein
MKTSNKLLIGLVVLIIIAIVAVNLIFNFQYKHRTQLKQIQSVEQPVNDTINSVTDSLEMEKAISNQ